MSDGHSESKNDTIKYMTLSDLDHLLTQIFIVGIPDRGCPSG